MTRLLSKIKDNKFINGFDDYAEKVRSRVNSNLELLRASVCFDNLGIFHDDKFMDKFTLTGALQITSMEDLGDAKSYFQTKNGRLFKKDEKFILRGPRYLAAIDPGLSIPQKLSIYLEDLHEAIEYLWRLRYVSNNDCHKYVAPVLDYAKNSVITIINALMNQEKRIRLDIDNPEYNKLKEEAIKAGRIITYSYYMSLIGEYNFDKIKDELSIVVKTAESICDLLIREYKNFIFSPRDIVRPEASHPVILLSFATLILLKMKDVNTVIGLPSGGTEIAFLVNQAMVERRPRKCDLILLPISLHSMLSKFGEQADVDTLLPRYWQFNIDLLKDKNILVVDDNSSSGATLQKVYTSLHNFCDSSNIEVAVAEADIKRSKLDLKSSNKRKYYSDLSVYGYSVGILPISRGIWRKHDLKEVLEAYSIGRYYSKLAKCSDLLDIIKAEVFKEEVIRPFERLVAEPEWRNIKRIDSFQNTFLSNFHKVRIPRRGKNFPSVEHAYQSAKFDTNTLLNMPTKLWHEIEHIADQHIPVVSDLFTTDCRSGSIKRIATLLTEKGLHRDNWDEIRVGIMIELLVTKFSHKELRDKLIQTKDFYLIEGNDWGDTFWGACKENSTYRGRNILGIILMNIRKKIINNTL